METSRKPHVAVFSSPGMGHRIPVLELAKCLAIHHSLPVTIFLATTPTTSPAELQLFHTAAATNLLLRVVELPPVDISGLLPSNAAIVTQLCFVMREASAVLRSAIAGVEAPPPTVLIADFFGHEAHRVARELHVPMYLYFPTSAYFFVLTSSIPVLDEEVEGEYVSQKEPLRVPGCKPVRPVDVVDPMMDRSDQQYEEYVRIGVGVSKADGILVNTWEDMEPRTLRALTEDGTLQGIVRSPVYPIGPIARPVEPADSRDETLEWLDRQPARSVLFVSFGSEGFLSGEQLGELASGLERSGHRFVWVVRGPPLDPSGPLGHLPVGFLTRTRETGLVVTSWAPQRAILAHESIGGFLSHCGWNSTVENLTGVGAPMIAWPLHAEQKVNAALLAEELRIAVRPEGLPPPPEGGGVVVGREEIERVVREVMEGGAMRERVEELKRSGMKALGKGGCSYNAMVEFVRKCH